MESFLLAFGGLATDLDHDKVGDMVCKIPDDHHTVAQSQEPGEACCLGPFWGRPKVQKNSWRAILDIVTHYGRLVLTYQIEKEGIAKA
jgi:hypothetical protein